MSLSVSGLQMFSAILASRVRVQRGPGPEGSRSDSEGLSVGDQTSGIISPSICNPNTREGLVSVQRLVQYGENETKALKIQSPDPDYSHDHTPIGRLEGEHRRLCSWMCAQFQDDCDVLRKCVWIRLHARFSM